jgi:AmmeMemoRadiSam system protein B
MSAVRPAAVAGLFYAGEPATLRAEVRDLLAGAHADPRPGHRLKLLVVPHAGYVYSGAVAAAGYALVRHQHARIQRVVLLGPTHRVAVRGVAIPTADGFATPLGAVTLDRERLGALARLPGVVANNVAHAAEHALEVQLPFLQAVLDRFLLVPLAVGHVDDDRLAAILDVVWGGDETLIVVSSDLSHYHAYDEARQIDGSTVDRILALTPGIDHEHACGATPINAAIALARRRGLVPRLLAACNSGDTSGDHSRVVGYCAIAFEEPGDVRH